MFLLIYIFFFNFICSYESPINDSFFQNKYVFEYQRTDVVWTDKSIIQVVNMKTNKYNRTAAALTSVVKLLVDVKQFQVNLLGYVLSGNEYKRTVLQFGINACDALLNNYYGMGVLKTHGNYTNCPIKKGYYGLINWTPNQYRFPPSLPAGDWKMEIKYVINGIHALTGNIYVAIKYNSLRSNN